MPRQSKPATLRDVTDAAALNAEQSDAFAELQRLFRNAVWRHEASGAIRIAPNRETLIEWSPRDERALGGFAATFGRWRINATVSDEQLEALLAYSAAISAPPPARSAAARAA